MMGDAFGPAAAKRFLRLKPFVFCVGLEKCGTSSMNDFLAQAANVSAPYPKELYFFTTNHGRGFDWYLAHYQLTQDVLLDFSPSYHWHTNALRRIGDLSGRSAVIVMLRHPIERAYSAYIHRIYWFFEAAFARGEAAEFDASFADYVERSHPYLFPSYIAAIERVEAAVGAARCLVVPLEPAIRDPGRYVPAIEERISTTIGLPDGVTFPRTNSLPVPTFFRGGEIIERDPEAADLIKSPDDVYFCRSGMPRRIAAAEAYDRLKALERKWLRPMEHSTAATALRRYYQSQIPAVEKRLGTTLDNWTTVRERAPRMVAPLAESAADTEPAMQLWRLRRLRQRGAFRQAAERVAEAIRRNPRIPEYHRLLAAVLLEIGDAAGAERHADQAVALAPANGEYHVFRQTVRNRIEIGRIIAP